jgi:hypothetical protein
VDGGHQAFDQAEVVVHDLRDRREAVGGAGGVRNDVLAGVGGVVHAHHEHRRVVLRRRRQHDPLGAGLDVGARLRIIEEQPGRFDHVLGADVVPLEVRGVPLRGDADGLAVDDELAVLHVDRSLELAVGRVVLEHVGHVIDVDDVVDPDDFDVLAPDGDA